MKKAMSLDEMSSMVRRAVHEMSERMMHDCWPVDVYEDSVIIEMEGYHFRAGYTMDGGEIMLAEREQWEMVEKEWMTKTLGTLTFFGDAVKALGGGKVGGYLVRFGSPEQTDLTGEYFDAATDFAIDDWSSAKCTIYYQHGMDDTLKTRVLGVGTLKKDDVGVFVEAQLALRDEYEKAVYDPLTTSNKMGWSSGTAGHLVERERVGKAVHIKRWPLGIDGSLTPTPAEPRTFAVPVKALHIVPLKSLMIAQPEAGADVPDGTQPAAKRVEVIDIVQDEGDVKMADNQTPPADERLTALEGQMKGIGEKIDSVLKYMEDAPAIKNAGFFSADGGTADKNLKSWPDYVMAVKRGDGARLQKVYGSVKDVTGDAGGSGGYLLPTEYRNDIMTLAEAQSQVVQRVQQLTVGARSGEWPALDFFNTPTAGSGNTAKAGKLTAAKRAEGGAYTETQPEFELIKWQLNDAASGYVEVSKEMSEDFAGMSSLLKLLFATAVSSKLEYYILNGNGVGAPLGILNAPALISITVDTNDTFAYADAVEMVSRHKNVSGRPSVWVHHPGVIVDVAAFQAATSSPATFITNMQGALPNNLLGYGMIASEHLPQANNSGFIVLADLGAYGLFKKGEMYIDYSEHAAFTSGKDTWRFGQRVDGQPLWKGTHTLADPQGAFTVSPFVKGDD